MQRKRLAVPRETIRLLTDLRPIAGGAEMPPFATWREASCASVVCSNNSVPCQTAMG